MHPGTWQWKDEEGQPAVALMESSCLDRVKHRVEKEEDLVGTWRLFKRSLILDFLETTAVLPQDMTNTFSHLMCQKKKKKVLYLSLYYVFGLSVNSLRLGKNLDWIYTALGDSLTLVVGSWLRKKYRLRSNRENFISPQLEGNHKG